MLIALAVALIGDTYERIGNEESAQNGRYGVSCWKRKHVNFPQENIAIISYIGKHGVPQKKRISNLLLVDKLRKACADKKPEDFIFETDVQKITNSDINRYLRRFEISAKDIRGYHANREMVYELKEIRKKGPSLPEDPIQRKNLLKSEFILALQKVSEKVGHEASTLQVHYLIPGLSESYLSQGIANFLKKGTKDISEKEDEDIRGLVIQHPDEKPPRKDRQRSRMREGIEDVKKDTSNDLSLNYKDN
jgi:hypothetical protein